MSDLKIKVGSEKDCVQTVTVEWPTSKVREKIDEAYEKLRHRTKIPGFRPGKTPLEIIKREYKESAHAHAQESLLREGVSQALETKKIPAIQPPVVQSMKFAEDKPFHFEFRVEVAPSFKVSGYKGLKLTKKTKEFGEAEVQQALEKIAQNNATLKESKEEFLTERHFAVVDYEGFLDDQPIQGAKAKDFLLDMSAPQAITGLTEGLIGIKVGEERRIPVTFPVDSPSKPLAGKEATFRVILRSIKEKKVPLLDDDFAKDIGVDSLGQLEERVRENLVREFEQASRKDLENQVIDKLIESNKFVVPPSLLEKQEKYLTGRFQDRLKQQGILPEDERKTLQGRQAEIRRQAEREVRLAYVLNAISEAEKVDVGEMDVEKRIADLASKSLPTEKVSFEKTLREKYKDRIENELKESKLFEFLIAQAKIKEISGGS